MTWLFLGIGIVSEVVATISLRMSDGFRKKWWIAPLIAGYVIAFSAITYALSLGMPIGVAYGIWVAGGIALTAILARILFKDPLTKMMALGIALIISGVFVIELSRHGIH